MKNFKNHILNISNNHYHSLINFPNVRGIGFGFKYINNICTYEPCIHVLVNKKINKIELSYDKLIPKYFWGIKTDVIESGHIKAHSLNDRTRPLKGGYKIQVKGEQDRFGTIGCIVSKGLLFKNYYILSNNHVLAGDNSFPKNTPIIQPPLNPKSEPTDMVAKLSDFVRIKFQTSFETPENTVDCAIAKLINPKNVSDKIALLGKITGVGIPILHSKVKKVGCITALTKGKIETIGATILSEFPHNKNALFKNQIITSKMSEEGDSGSLLLDSNNYAVGLLMGGSHRVSTFNDINLVLKELSVNFL